MRRLLQPMLSAIHHSFLLRWILVNLAGWAAALHLLGLAVRNDAIIVVVAFGLAGVLFIALAQWWVLRVYLAVGLWWVLVTTLAVLLGGLLDLLATPITTALTQSLHYTLLGALVGLLIGWCQWLILRRFFGRQMLWLFANLLGGALCASISLPLNFSRSLLGAALLGLITGYALLVMGRSGRGYAHEIQ